MKIQISSNWIKGLGTQLCALSVFLNSGIKELEVSDMRIYNSLEEYKKIFNLNELHINLRDSSTEMLNSISPTDFFKLFSPYYKKFRVLKKRPFIGISCYQDTSDVFCGNISESVYPKNKCYPLEIYSEIFKFVKKSGYDLITLDSKNTSITDKAWMIENLCECVIGYEGGIAHLSHMLDVPFIMLPWREGSIGTEQLLHLDNKTYFLENLGELLTWFDHQNKLSEIIVNLNKGYGNNKFLNKNDRVIIDDKFKIYDFERNLIPIDFNDGELDFFQNHLHHLTLGGQ